MNRITCRRRTPSKRELLEFEVELINNAFAIKDHAAKLTEIEPSYEDAYVVIYETALCKVMIVRGGTLLHVTWKDSGEVDYLEAAEAFELVQSFLRGLAVIGEDREPA